MMKTMTIEGVKALPGERVTFVDYDPEGRKTTAVGTVTGYDVTGYSINYYKINLEPPETRTIGGVNVTIKTALARPSDVIENPER